MNNKKLKKEYIILGVVIIALLFYLILKKSDKVNYEIPGIKPLVKEDIGKVEIRWKGKTIVLNKKEKKWAVGEKKYPADESKINNIIDTIAGLSLSEMVSESQNYRPYELDEKNKIAVKAYKDDDILREFEIGKQASTYGHTFVKIAGDDKVYHAEKSFRGYFDREIDDLRDKTVLTFDKNEISEIQVISEGREYQFSKKVTVKEPKPPEDKDKSKEKIPPAEPEEKIQWLTADGKEGEKTKLDSFINQLSDLRCDKYLEDKELKDFEDKNPVLKLTLKGSKNYTLSLFEKLGEGDEDKDKFPALSSENAYPFLLSGHKGDNFIRDAKELLKEEEKKENEDKKEK
ncbi:MAG: DUF4340 domain-containing protein [Candidatus Aminicenantes bacterium]|nr:DUF4340 domain-containing protein [Candidatus Aminicenantes bacterium]